MGEKRAHRETKKMYDFGIYIGPRKSAIQSIKFMFTVVGE